MYSRKVIVRTFLTIAYISKPTRNCHNKNQLGWDHVWWNNFFQPNLASQHTTHTYTHIHTHTHTHTHTHIYTHKYIINTINTKQQSESLLFTLIYSRADISPFFFSAIHVWALAYARARQLRELKMKRSV